MSPIGYCHVLLIPQIQECLPQRVDQESFLLAMYVAREAKNPFFRVGYNSLGAFATINHLHFQVSSNFTDYLCLMLSSHKYYLSGILSESAISSRKGADRENHSRMEWSQDFSAGAVPSKRLCIRRRSEAGGSVTGGLKCLYLLARE